MRHDVTSRWAEAPRQVVSRQETATEKLTTASEADGQICHADIPRAMECMVRQERIARTHYYNLASNTVSVHHEFVSSLWLSTPRAVFSQSTNAGDDGTKLMLQCMPVLPQDPYLVDPAVVGAGPRTVAWGLPRHARVARPRRVVVMVVMMMAMATAVVVGSSRRYLLGVVVIVCARARFDAETHVSKSVGSLRLMAWYVGNR